MFNILKICITFTLIYILGLKERKMKNFEKIWKVEKFVGNLHDKKEYVIHTRNLKQTLNHGLVLKKVHRVIKSNQKALLNPCIDMNTDLRIKRKRLFEKKI